MSDSADLYASLQDEAERQRERAEDWKARYLEAEQSIAKLVEERNQLRVQLVARDAQSLMMSDALQKVIHRQCESLPPNKDCPFDAGRDIPCNAARRALVADTGTFLMNEVCVLREGIRAVRQHLETWRPILGTSFAVTREMIDAALWHLSADRVNEQINRRR